MNSKFQHFPLQVNKVCRYLFMYNMNSESNTHTDTKSSNSNTNTKSSNILTNTKSSYEMKILSINYIYNSVKSVCLSVFPL